MEKTKKTAIEKILKNFFTYFFSFFSKKIENKCEKSKKNRNLLLKFSDLARAKLLNFRRHQKI